MKVRFWYLVLGSICAKGRVLVPVGRCRNFDHARNKHSNVRTRVDGLGDIAETLFLHPAAVPWCKRQGCLCKVHCCIAGACEGGGRIRSCSVHIAEPNREGPKRS